MNIQDIRKQFPILERKINGKPLVYFDNAATTQKPLKVIESISNYYTMYNANVHRGVHTLSQEATALMEETREKVQQFINAKKTHEIIFTKGTTESINLLAFSIESQLKKGDQIIVSQLEHHSNLVPWQLLAQRSGAELVYIPLQKSGALDMDAFDTILSERTKLVAINHISNALGIVNPIQEMIHKAHQYNAWVLIDGAQAVAHSKIDVQSLDVDFYVFSAHKMYGPTGVGIFYGKEKLLENLPPFHGGGEMIETVNMECSTFAALPFKFEAGTPNIAGNIALGAAIDFIQTIGISNIEQHENILLQYAQEKLQEIKNIIVYASTLKKAGAISFNLNIEGVHSSDVGAILDKQAIAVRTGQHCAQPIMDFLSINGTVRASFAIYNTKEEIDIFIEALKKAIRLLQ